ncbi:MAG: hypothetical protein EA376_06520 [Phycisphaeraceae bacterium]|nr:MAG: hypothetical protein EA376_06520 [Phycisphaeraceae bacterium]
MILYFAGDLIWATKIKGAADAMGLPCRPVRSIEMLDARLADSPVSSLIVDLDHPGEALEMIRHVRAEAADAEATGPESGEKLEGGLPPAGAGVSSGKSPGRIRIVAFGPHVERAVLQQARDAGADDVLTRGAFDHNMPEILTSLAGRG